MIKEQRNKENRRRKEETVVQNIRKEEDEIDEENMPLEKEINTCLCTQCLKRSRIEAVVHVSRSVRQSLSFHKCVFKCSVLFLILSEIGEHVTCNFIEVQIELD